MNERIQELAEQAILQANEAFDQKGKDYPGIVMEKFAELIVKECLLCCEQVISDPVPKSVDTFEQGGIHCMDEIKQHFGVER